MAHRAYVDANVLIGIWQGNSQANQFVNEVKAGSYKIFLSHFVLSEVLHATRNIVMGQLFKSLATPSREAQSIEVATNNFRNSFDELSKRAYQQIIDFVTSNQDQIEQEPQFSNYPLDLFYQARNVLNEIKGTFKVYEIICKKCGHYIVECSQCNCRTEPKFKAVNSQDVLHMLIAQAYKCDYLITADKGFRELETRALPVRVKIL